jgi:hypothetical protein
MRILPRQFGQVLNDALNSLARTWRPLITTSVMVFVPVGAVALAVFELSGATDFLEVVFSETAALDTLPDTVFMELARPFLIATGIALGVQGLATIFVYLFAHRLTVLDIRGETWGVGSERRRALRRYGKALVAVVAVVVVAAGLLTLAFFIWGIPLAMVGTPNSTSSLIAAVLLVGLVTPGIWLLISQSMLTTVVAVEEVGIIESWRRSRRLVRGRWWPTFGFLALIGLLGSLAIELIQLVAIPLSLVGEVGSGLLVLSLLGLAAQGPIIAAMGAAHTHWYVDLRSRQEVLLADQL